MENTLVCDEESVAEVFNLWAARYAADPSQFGQVLDAQGQPVTDYGKQAAAHFMQLAREIDEACP